MSSPNKMEINNENDDIADVVPPPTSDNSTPFAMYVDPAQVSAGLTYTTPPEKPVSSDDSASEGSRKDGKGRSLNNDCNDSDINDPYLNFPDARPSGIVEFVLHNVSSIKDWTKDKKLTGPPTIIRCLPWRVLVMHRCDNARSPPMLSFFIQCNGESTDTGWSCRARAELILVGNENLLKPIEHTFHSKENDWGFVNFIALRDLMNPESGYVRDDSIHLKVKVTADPPHGGYWDSKKLTGFVGLKNQGATCYMNSLLQALYCTNKLRRAVYQMPTDTDDSQRSVALSLQRVFYRLQFSKVSVGTKKLTRSFGWDSGERFLQHDVQEFCRVLLDNVENKMRGSPLADTIPSLFCGKMLSYIKCKHVDYVSQREEPFYDIQLRVKGNATLHDAFKDYVAVETLEKENRYDAGPYGLQDSDKGVIFLQFPPVLYLQLMRFQYDPITDTNIKINDRFEFPYILDLDDFLKEKDTAPARFFLHAVLVHSGDNHAGHYVAYLNPRGDNQWYRFDDEVVCKCTPRDAMNMNFGLAADQSHHENGGSFNTISRNANAYMLVYILEARKDEVLAPITEADLPMRLKERFTQEIAAREEKLRLRQEMQHSISVNLILEEDFAGWQGHYICSASARQVRYPKSFTYAQFLRRVLDEVSLKPDNVRLWFLKTRSGATMRPSFERLTEEVFHIGFTDVFLEVLPTVSGSSGVSAYRPGVDTLLFVKYFDVGLQELLYLGHIIAPKQATLTDVLAPMLKQISSQLKDSSSSSLLSSSSKKFTYYFELPFDGEVIRVESPQNKLSECLRQAHLSHEENGHIVTVQFLPDAKQQQQQQQSSALNETNVVKRVNNVEDYFRFTQNHVDVLFMDRSLVLQSVMHGSATSGLSATSSTSTPSDNTSLNNLNNGNSPPAYSQVTNKIEDNSQQLSGAAGGGGPRLSQHLWLSNGHVGSAQELAHNYHGFFLSKLPTKLEYWPLVEAVVAHVKKHFPQVRLASGAPLTSEYVQLFLAGVNTDTPVPSEEDVTLHQLVKTPHESSHNTMYGRLTTVILDDRKPHPISLVKPRRTFQYRLFYQILDSRISEVEAIRTLRVWYVPANIQEEIEVSVAVSIHATVENFMEKVLLRLKSILQHTGSASADNSTKSSTQASTVSSPSQVQGANGGLFQLPSVEELRLWEVMDHRLVLEHTPRTLLSDVIASLTKTPGSRYLRVDARPADEKEVGHNDMILPVAHFSKDTLHTHGLPFTLKVSDGELISDVIERIRVRLNVPQKEIAKWRFVLVVDNQIISVLPTETISVAYLQQQISESTNRNMWPTHRGVWIGLDHPQVFRREEKAVKIHN